MQVLSFHRYCTLSPLSRAPRLTVILAGTDIKTALHLVIFHENPAKK
jgi:hypothetical protein